MSDNTPKVTKQQTASLKESKRLERERKGEEARLAHENFVADEANWEYVDIPDVDLFDKPFGNITINSETYGPGRHFVDPDLASEIRRILKARMASDQRIYRPTQDKKMLEIMARQGKPVTVTGISGADMDEYMRRETGMK